MQCLLDIFIFIICLYSVLYSIQSVLSSTKYDLLEFPHSNNNLAFTGIKLPITVTPICHGINLKRIGCVCVETNRPFSEAI